MLSKKIKVLGLKNLEKGWMYFIDEQGDVSRAALIDGRKPPKLDAKGMPLDVPRELVAKAGVKWEQGFLYYLDMDGDIAQVQLSVPTDDQPAVEKVVKLGIKVERPWIYLLDKHGALIRLIESKIGSIIKEVLAKPKMKREKGYHYFLDNEGDISRTKMEELSAPKEKKLAKKKLIKKVKKALKHKLKKPKKKKPKKKAKNKKAKKKNAKRKK